jgi:uncharacterized protein YqeY
MSKREEFNAALKSAMKEKDQTTISTVRLILAALKERDIEARTKGKDGVEDSEILSMLQSMIKQRRESAKTYTDNGRPELAEREEREVAIIEGFLPKQLDDAEVAAAIDAAIAETGAADIKDMGKIMGVLKSKYAGQVDMGKAGGLVKQKLSA